MNFFPIREQTWRFLRAFFMTSTCLLYTLTLPTKA